MLNIIIISTVAFIALIWMHLSTLSVFNKLLEENKKQLEMERSRVANLMNVILHSQSIVEASRKKEIEMEELQLEYNDDETLARIEELQRTEA